MERDNHAGLENSSLETCMEHSDYPLLFRITDEGAITAQSRYLALVKIEFSVLILAAILSSIRPGTGAWSTCLFAATPVLLFVALIARVLTELVGFDKKWFSRRAIAESVKGLTWRYMTRAKPYDGDPNSEEIDKEFLKDLREIRDSQLEGAKELGKQITSGDDITQPMRDIRGMPFDERKSRYNRERVVDQKEWYSKKAISNARSRAFWFWSSIILEGIAVVLAFLLTHKPPLPFNPVAILIAVVAVVIAWTQIRKHRELSQSYSLVVLELGQISAMYVHVDSEPKLSDYVENAEEVISKEHTMWLAKRETRIGT